MTTFKHRNGQTVTAEPGTKRYAIFERSRNWQPVARHKVTATKAGPAAETQLSDLTVAELRALADERGIDVPSKVRKDDLIALLEG